MHTRRSCLARAMAAATALLRALGNYNSETFTTTHTLTHMSTHTHTLTHMCTHTHTHSHVHTHTHTNLSSFSIAACSCIKVVLGSSVKLAVLPSDDVTFIFLEAGGEEECEGVSVVLVVLVGWEEVGGWVGDFCGPCSKSFGTDLCVCFCVYMLCTQYAYSTYVYTYMYCIRCVCICSVNINSKSLCVCLLVDIVYSTCDTYIQYICASCKSTLSCDAVCMFRVKFAVREKMIEFEPLNLSETSKEPHTCIYVRT